MYIYLYVYLNHFAVYLKLTQHCNQLDFNKKKSYNFIGFCKVKRRIIRVSQKSPQRLFGNHPMLWKQAYQNKHPCFGNKLIETSLSWKQAYLGQSL